MTWPWAAMEGFLSAGLSGECPRGIRAVTRGGQQACNHHVSGPAAHGCSVPEADQEEPGVCPDRATLGCALIPGSRAIVGAPGMTLV